MTFPSYEDLSHEQDAVFNLPLDGNFLVSGPPGTGKSVMALYRAQVLSIDERTSVILMFNNVLKQYTELYATKLGVEGSVETFHRWFRGFWRNTYGSDPPKAGADEWAYDWTETSSRFIGMPPRKGELGDLIVDEGQDLPIGFYRIAHRLCGNITVFADENQQLRKENTRLAQIEGNVRTVGHLALRRNYRNSIEIAKLAAHFYTGTPTGIPDPPTRSRKPGPQVRAFRDIHEFVDVTARYAKNHSNLRIGIALPKSPLQIQTFNLLRRCGVKVETYVWNDDDHKKVNFAEPGVKIINYMSLKGLEFDTLFVPELQLVDHDVSSATIRMKFYVIMSRARNELYLSYIGDHEPPIVSDIPHDLLERV